MVPAAAPDLAELTGDVSRSASLPAGKVRGALELLMEGATVPFIARYRKERTGGLDERALRAVEDGLGRFRELYERRGTILPSLLEQGKLDEDLRRQVPAP